ncbi:aspartate aminotransferase family protein [Aquibium sp. LZ166]|uniref:Aspartate aminotransferase family protein n=1 Tax=Aquibium pacificus TaxID=3153579 RepID=A0ABV3SLC6_9HYPH
MSSADPAALPNSPHARDKAYALHPYTNARAHERRGPTVIESGKGIYVRDDQGNEYIEGLAGLWSVAVGFGEERLVEAAAAQMRRLPYYHSFSHKANNPAIDLAEKVASLAPAGLNRVFFANSGSEANDTVVKLLWYFNNARGRPQKKKIISRIRGYHGITVASGSMTGLPWNHRDFDLPLPNFLHTACPHHYRHAWEGESEEEFASRLAGQLEQLILAEGPATIAAFIGEPVMGAGGVLVPPRTYWQKVQAVCRKYDVLIIADEVITGFGRTGRMFGCELFDIKPDMLVLSKQITSSYLPLSAIVISDELYAGIADNSDRLGNFGHGFTTSGHPVATAVALENIRIIEEDGLVANAAAMGERLQAGLGELRDHPMVGEVRGVGLIAAVELVADPATKRAFDPLGKVGAAFFERGHGHGLIVRAVQDSIALCPPLIINAEQVDEVLKRFRLTLDDTYTWSRENFA